MFRLLIVFLFVTYGEQFFAQSVNIVVYNTSSPGFVLNGPKIIQAYETSFGVGNVSLTNTSNTSLFVNYDIVIVQTFFNVYPQSLVNDLVNYIQNGGHVILSTEQSTLPSGDYFMPDVWNTLTGGNINQHIGPPAAFPPRFHNSNGPWGLSPDITTGLSTRSHDSFSSVNQTNVVHWSYQYIMPKSCKEIRAVSAVYPSRPNLSDGTLYIQAESAFPFTHYYNTPSTIPGNDENHTDALVRMHHTLIKGNQTMLDRLNLWTERTYVDNNFLNNDTLVCKGSFPLVLTSPNYASYSWEDIFGNVLGNNQNLIVNDTGTYVLRTTGFTNECDGIDTIKIGYDTIMFEIMTHNTCPNVSGGDIEVLNVTGNNLTPPVFYQINNSTPILSNNFNNLSSGSYLIKVSDSRGCVDSANTLISVFDSSIVDFRYDTVCFGANTSFYDESLPFSGNNIIDWNWTIGGGSYNGSTISGMFLVNSLMEAKLKITDNNGCSDSITKFVNYHSLPSSNFITNFKCEGEKIEFINRTEINGIMYNNNYNFSWDFGDGGISNSVNPKYQYQNHGVFNVQLSSISEENCVGDTMIQLTIYEKPNADFNSDSVCLGDTLKLFDLSSVSTGNIQNWSWKFDSKSNDIQNLSHLFSEQGEYEIRLIVSSNEGCKDTVGNNIVIFSLPYPMFKASINEIDRLNSKVTFYNESIGATSYQWIFDGSVLSNDFEPEVNFSSYDLCEDIKNKLIVKTEFGCMDSISIPIKTKGHLLFYMPTSFTPNMDMINDILKPVFMDLDVQDYYYEIFNSWGESIFRTNNIDEGWDGTYAGKVAKEGVYIWRIRTRTVCDNLLNKFLIGHFSLIR